MIQHRKLYFLNPLQYTQLNIPFHKIAHCKISACNPNQNQILYKDINTLLGKSYDLIVFKDILNITPNAFCIAAGTIRKNGALILLSEHKIDELKEMDFVAHNNFFGNEKIFFRRFFHFYKLYSNNEELCFGEENYISVNSDSELISKSNLDFEEQVLSILASKSQKIIFKKLADKFTNSILISERGCGKSALLGVLAAFYSIKMDCNLEILNPSDTFFEYFTKVLKIAEIFEISNEKTLKCFQNMKLESKTNNQENDLSDRIKVHHNNLINPKESIYSKDETILKNISVKESFFPIKFIKEALEKYRLRPKNCLKLDLRPAIKTIYFVDEAASLPLNKINDLLAQNVILSTTIHGYEGTGKSFVHKIIKKIKIDVLKLEEQLRFDKDDCLENFINEVFFLNSQIINETDLNEFQDSNLEDEKVFIPQTELVFQKVNKQKLIENEEELTQLCTLLVSEHYRNSPDDLLFLLDSPKVEIFVLKTTKIIAALCHTKEGKKEITKCGNLIPHLFQEKYFDSSYFDKNGSRIIRIVVHPQFRNQNFGSELIKCFLKQNNFDFIGVSFGLNDQLLHFWQKNQFLPVNLSKSINPNTNEHTLVMLYQETNPYFYTETLKLAVNRYKSIDPLLMLKLLFPVSIYKKLDFDELELKKIAFFQTKSLDCCCMTETLKDIAYSQLFNPKFGVLEVILLYTVGVNNWAYREYLNLVKLDSSKLKSVITSILKNVDLNLAETYKLIE